MFILITFAPSSPFVSSTYAQVPDSAVDAARLDAQSAAQQKQQAASPNSTDWLQDTITGIVYAFTVFIGSWIAYIGSYVFGFAAGITLQSEAYSLGFLSQMWVLVRDIANMAFLFMLIYIAFTVMFRADNHGTMQLLAGVIVVALLVNFSFFFTRVIIDAGNILAVQFYNAINVPYIHGTIKDLSAVIMQGTEVQQILDQDSFRSFSDQQTGVSGWFATVGALSAIYITVGIMLFILAAMFLVAGIKLLLRTAVLWLAIIASPLAFIGAALPQTRGKAEEWLNILVSHAFYPAVFLFLFLIIERFVDGMGGSGTIVSQALLSAQSSQGGILNVAQTIANVSIRLGFIILLLYLAIKLSDKVSVAGGDFAKSAAGWAIGRPFGLGASALGFAGRNISGRMMTNWSKSPNIAAGAQKAGLTGTLWRGTERATKRLGSATYDIRNAPGAGLAKKAFEGVTGLSPTTGIAATKGFAERTKEASEKAAKARNERAAIIRDAANEAALKRIIDGTGTIADEDRVKGFSKRDIENIEATDLAKIAHLFNEDKTKAVDGSDKFNDAEKDAVRKISEPIAKSQKIIGDELRKLNSSLRSGVQANVVAANTARGQIMNNHNANAMRQDIQAQIASVRTKINTNPSQADLTDLRHDLNQLHNALNSVGTLESNLRKTLAHAGNSAGEFKITS